MDTAVQPLREQQEAHRKPIGHCHDRPCLREKLGAKVSTPSALAP